MKFVDVEDLARRRLQQAGVYAGGASVHIKVPKERPATFLRVWRTGGAATNRVLDLPLITVESWSATSDKIAADNANVARQLLLNASAVMPLVRGVEEVTGPFYDPDPVSGVTRYTFTVRMRVRATR
jgi:hypothetical protein